MKSFLEEFKVAFFIILALGVIVAVLYGLTVFNIWIVATYLLPIGGFLGFMCMFFLIGIQVAFFYALFSSLFKVKEKEE